MKTRIADVVEIAPFEDVITLEMASRKNDMIGQYIMTESIVTSFKSLLEGFIRLKGSSRKSYIVEGAYGVGKSHFLLFASYLVESTSDKSTYHMVEEKIKGTSLYDQFKEFIENNQDVLLIRIDLKNYSRIPLDQILVDAFKECAQEKVDHDFTYNHEFEEIKEILEKWKKTNETEYKQVMEIIKSKDVSSEQFFDGLKRYNSKMVEFFKESYYQVLNSHVNLRPVNILDAIQDFMDYINEKGFSGLVICIDEITTFFESLSDANRVVADLNTLESLSEFTQNVPLLLVGTTLERGITISAVPRINWEKATDRIERIPLKLLNLVSMIKSKIKILNNNKIKSAFITSNFSGFYDSDKTEFRKLLEIYPFHPLTIKILEQASGLFSQTRSVFSFISTIGENFISEIPLVENNALKFISPDFVYDYFNEDFQKKNTEIMAVIESILNSVKIPLKVAIVKTIGLGSVLTPRLPISSDFLEKAYLRDETEVNFREILADFSVHFLERGDGHLIVSGTSSKNIKLLNQRASEIYQKNFNDLFVRYIGNSLSVQNTIEFVGTQQKLRFRYTLISEVKKVITNPDHDYLTFHLIIPSNSQNFKEQMLLSDEKTPEIFLVLANTNFDKKKLSFFLAATEIVNTNPDLTPDDRDYFLSQITNINILRYMEKALDDCSMKIFTSSGLYSYEQRVLEVGTIPKGFKLELSHIFLKKISTHVLSDVYPVLKKLNFGTSVATRGGGQITKMVEEVFIFNRTKWNAAVMNRIKSILVPLGFAQEIKTGYILTLPKDGIQREIYDNIKEKIKESDSCYDLYEYLHNPPYGFTEVVFEIYLTALAHFGRISLFSGKRLHKITSKGEVQEIGKNPRKFTIKITETLNPEEWRLIKNIWPLIDRNGQNYESLNVLPSNMYIKVSNEFKADLIRNHKIADILFSKITGLKDALVPTEMEKIQRFIQTYSNSSFVEPTESLQFVTKVLSEIFETTEINKIWNTFKDYYKIYSLVSDIIDNYYEDLKNINSYIQKVIIPEDQEKLTKRRGKLLKMVNSIAKDLPHSKNDIKKLKDNFNEFKQEYSEKYIKEHRFLSDTYENFLSGYNEFVDFKIYGFLQGLDTKVVPELKEKLESIIINKRDKRCKFDPTKILELLPTCNCEYNLGELYSEIDQLNLDQERIKAQLNQDLISSIQKFNNTLPVEIGICLGDICKDEPQKYPILVEKIPQIKQLFLKVLEQLELPERPDDLEEISEDLISIGTEYRHILNKLLNYEPDTDGVSEDEPEEIHINELLYYLKFHLRLIRVRPPHDMLKKLIKDFFEEHKDSIIVLE